MLRLADISSAAADPADELAAPVQVTISRDFDDPYLELLRLLREAAEIEHALMVQYLYAAFSIRPQYSRLQGATSASARNLMGVAIQEMKHLSAVNRLLVELGATPCLERQDLPYEPEIYPFAFELERLTPLSLAKYTWTEAPAGALEPGPASSAEDRQFFERLAQTLGEDTRPNHLGSLYGTMIVRLRDLAAAPPPRLPDVASWEARLAAIKDEGEDAHYHFFRSVLMGKHAAFDGDEGIWSRPPDDPRYPSFPVPHNPTALIAHPQAQRPATVPWLGNLHYWMVLMLLDLGYRHAMPTFNIAKRHMTEPLTTLGRALAAKGDGMPFDLLSMGYACGVDRAGSVEVVRRLADEADRVAQGLAAAGELPADYPPDINAVTAQQLAQMEA
jgi:rubrerythrin